MFSFLAQANPLAETMMLFAEQGAVWVLWTLILASLVSFAMFFERMIFLRRVKTNTLEIQHQLVTSLNDGNVETAISSLEENISMPARVISYGLGEVKRGRQAVKDLCEGALGAERLRYERGLSVLATIGSNAPFVGLFGTVMGVIVAFNELGAGGGEASTAVMAAIAEALIATGVGLLVAIPAIVFYNMLKAKVKRTMTDTELLVKTVLAHIA